VRPAPAAVSTELLAASKVAASKAARSEGGGAGVLDRLRRRGARAGAQISAVTPAPPPPPLPPPLPVQRGSFWWAVLANWLSFFALGLSIPVLGRVIATLVNEDGSPDVSPASAVLSGDVESLDKLITFLFVGFHGALSDVVGRKPLMAWSALGFATTCLLQATASRGVAVFYLADLVDGVTSCMSPVCQAYVADVSPPERRAINLGIFQGVSVAGAFILGFPLSAILDAKYGLRAPLYAAAAAGVLNFVVIALLVPESLPAPARTKTRLDLRAANPIGALRRLFCSTPLLRRSAAAFALLWLGNMCINSQFGNYANHLFKWGPQDSAPILVLIGLMIGVAPAALIPRLGLRTSMQTGGAVYAVGLLAIAFARTPAALVSCVLFMTLGCIALPALVSFVAAQAPPAERGALLGALETLQDLCDTLAFSGYGRLFAASIEPPAKLPGAVFLVAAALLSAFLATVQSAFRDFPAASAAFLAS